jgi:uncharacterized protein (DUF697 family)
MVDISIVNGLEPIPYDDILHLTWFQLSHIKLFTISIHYQSSHMTDLR